MSRMESYRSSSSQQSHLHNERHKSSRQLKDIRAPNTTVSSRDSEKGTTEERVCILTIHSKHIDRSSQVKADHRILTSQSGPLGRAGTHTRNGRRDNQGAACR